jgi:glycosyltransferase involved in cell wall biosynthesis
MLYLDVTDTYSNWSGSPTGIQRVLQKILEVGNDKPCKIKGTVFDVENFCWREIHSNTFNKIFVEKKSNLHFNYDLNRQFYKAISTPVYNLLPHCLAKIYTRFQARITNNKVVTKPGRKISGSIINFEKNDLILIADSSWNTLEYINIIKSSLPNPRPKILGFIHDIIPITHPHFVDEITTNVFSDWITDLVDFSDILITNSEYTRSETCDFLKSKGQVKEVFSVKFGNAQKSTNNLPHVGKYEVITKIVKANPHIYLQLQKWQNRYAIWVSSLDARKNADLVIRACLHLIKNEIDFPPIIFVGRQSRGVGVTVEWITKHTDLKRYTTLIGNLSDIELDILMREALFLIQSSWAEGYGLTVDEALTQSIPCLVSNATSLPEVGGSIVDYFDPNNPMELASLIDKYSNDESYRKLLVERVKKHPKVEWSETVNQILALNK